MTAPTVLLAAALVMAAIAAVAGAYLNSRDDRPRRTRVHLGRARRRKP